LPHWLKRRLTFLNKHSLAAALLAALWSTYLDLYFVGKGLYAFPWRPFAELFPINILFTLIVLPIFMMIFLYWAAQVNGWGKAGMILFISLLMTILEKFAEQLGLFNHSKEWQHLYTFIGYLLFLTVIMGFHSWLRRSADE